MKKVVLAGLMSGLALCIVTAAMLLSPGRSLAASPKGKKEAMIHAGQDVFSQRCMQCHSVTEGQAMFGPSLYHEMRKAHTTDASVRAILQNGKGKMPPFKDKLTPEDTDNLLAYLHTL